MAWWDHEELKSREDRSETYILSFLVKPQATNRHIWKRTTGEDMKIPQKKATII